MLDTDKAQTLGIPIIDVYNALQTFLGGLYVNDFNRFGRTWRVMMQAEPSYREQSRTTSIAFYVRTSSSDMVPLSTLVSVKSRHRSRSDLSLSTVIERPRLSDRMRRASATGQAASAMEEDRRAKPARRLRLRVDRNGVPADGSRKARKVSYSVSPPSWCSYSWPRFTRAGAIPFAVVLAVPLGLFGALVGV